MEVKNSLHVAELDQKLVRKIGKQVSNQTFGIGSIKIDAFLSEAQDSISERSSAGEHRLHTAGAAGSIPVARTTLFRSKIPTKCK